MRRIDLEFCRKLEGDNSIHMEGNTFDEMKIFMIKHDSKIPLRVNKNQMKIIKEYDVLNSDKGNMEIYTWFGAPIIYEDS